MQITRITIAVTHIEDMVAFYNEVCHAHLVPQLPFYRGELAGIDLLFCPNEIAGVDAKQNRQQFRFEVDDIHTVLEAVRQNGGEILNEGIENGVRLVGVRDPDGNTIEFRAKASNG
jgi:catechol 2,3-dioxygenase-like lactoylglutathione lyase family enzyme